MAGPRFVSPGGMAGSAIQEFLMQRELMNRQRLLDELAQKSQADNVRIAEGELQRRTEQNQLQAETQRQAQADLAVEREFRRAGTIDQTAMPGDVLDPETAAMLERQGFGSRVRKVPGVVQQGAQVGTVDDDVPLYDVTQGPETIQHRGGSQYLAARTAAEERAAMAEQAQAAAAERADAQNSVQMLIAQVGASGRADSTALRNELLRIQAKLAETELDTKRTELDTKQRDVAQRQTNVATDRARIRDLAQGLIDNPALDSITGPLEGRRDTFLGAENVKAKTLFDQLGAALAFEGRSKMKGQGTITDYEAKAVERVMNALNRAAGPKITRDQLREIVAAFQGDSPIAGQSTATDPRDPLLDELLGGR